RRDCISKTGHNLANGGTYLERSNNAHRNPGGHRLLDDYRQSSNQCIAGRSSGAKDQACCSTGMCPAVCPSSSIPDHLPAPAKSISPPPSRDLSWRAAAVQGFNLIRVQRLLGRLSNEYSSRSGYFRLDRGSQ